MNTSSRPLLKANTAARSPLHRALMTPFTKTPVQGSQTSIYLASSPEVEGISGKYWDNCK